MTATKRPSSKSVLIVCSHYWPSVGGLETSMSQLGGQLLQAGYRVDVMTLAFPGRTADEHAGIRILGIEMGQFQAAIRAAVASGEYDAAILVQDPLGHIVLSVEGLKAPKRTRVLIQPIINEDGYGRWKDNADFRTRLAKVLKGAGAALTMTRSGPDTRFMREAGVPYTYIPNASLQATPAGDFRAAFGIDAGAFMMLHVANLYPVKNHLALIDALPGLPANWKLVMIGNVVGGEYAEQVLAKLASRPEILFVPGLPAEWIAAAMRAADVAMLASKGEGSPITLLEAMSFGKPWLATPQCGAANDHAGGLICDLPDFLPNLRVLAERPQLRAELGAISLEHWRRCYSWPEVTQGWIELIEQGRMRRTFEPGADLDEQMTRLKRAIAARRAQARPVTIVVQALADAAALEAALAAAQAEAGGQAEVLLVNRTGQPYEALARRLHVHAYLALPDTATPAEARAAAIRAAGGHWLAFAGADPQAGWLAAALDALGTSGTRLAGAGADDLAVLPATLDGWVIERALAVDTGAFDPRLGPLAEWEWLLRAAAHGEPAALPGAPQRPALDDAASRALAQEIYARHPAPTPEIGAARLRVLEPAADGERLDLMALINRAEDMQRRGEHAGIVALYRGWLAGNASPLRYAACFNLGIALEQQGDVGAALQAYRDCLRASPGFAPARERLAAHGQPQ